MSEGPAKSFEWPSYVLSTAPWGMSGDVDKMGKRRDSITKEEGLYHSPKQSCQREAIPKIHLLFCDFRGSGAENKTRRPFLLILEK